MIDDLDEMLDKIEDAQDEADRRVEGTNLNWGVNVKTGRISYYARCCSCGEKFELCYDPEEHSDDMSYCAGSFRCIP